MCAKVGLEVRAAWEAWVTGKYGRLGSLGGGEEWEAWRREVWARVIFL
ncbi:hypothetical protein [Actinobaculum suis]|nr:hypothetical protein [Actinobaculum suis]